MPISTMYQRFGDITSAFSEIGISNKWYFLIIILIGPSSYMKRCIKKHAVNETRTILNIMKCNDWHRRRSPIKKKIKLCSFKSKDITWIVFRLIFSIIKTNSWFVFVLLFNVSVLILVNTQWSNKIQFYKMKNRSITMFSFFPKRFDQMWNITLSNFSYFDVSEKWHTELFSFRNWYISISYFEYKSKFHLEIRVNIALISIMIRVDRIHSTRWSRMIKYIYIYIYATSINL